MTEENPLDNYLVWELCKDKEDIQRRIIEGSDDGEELNQVVKRVRKKYRKRNYGRNEKMELLRKLDNNPDYRSRIFESCSWKKETVSVKDLGTTLPRLGDIPPEVISGSLKDVLEFVREAEPDENRNVKYILSLKQFPEVLDEFFPWVVTPGNRESKRERMNRAHGEKEWDIEETWGMINDGNHRTIAKILANNLEEIECYVGRRQKHD